MGITMEESPCRVAVGLGRAVERSMVVHGFYFVGFYFVGFTSPSFPDDRLSGGRTKVQLGDVFLHIG